MSVIILSKMIVLLYQLLISLCCSVIQYYSVTCVINVHYSCNTGIALTLGVYMVIKIIRIQFGLFSRSLNYVVT